MAFTHKYPYTDFSELNLDWIIDKFQTLEYATGIVYDPEASGLSATNVQAAIDEIMNLISSQSVLSFNGRVGAVTPQAGDYNISDMGDATISSPVAGEILAYNGTIWINSLSYSETSGATLTLYVNGTSGSDSNDGLTSDTAFASISKALAVSDSRFKNINVSGTLTESVNVDGANARITFNSGTIDLTISRTLNIFCNLALVNSTATVNLTFSGTWITGNLTITGASGYEVTINDLPNIRNGSVYLLYCKVTLSSAFATINSTIRIANCDFTMGGNSFTPTSTQFNIATTTFTGCGAYLFNTCRGLVGALTTITHDATDLLRGTAVINYSSITGSVNTGTYGTSLIV